MSLDKLIQSILHDARHEAGQIEAQAEAEVDQILVSARTETEAQAKRLFEAGVERGRRESAQRVSQARLSARNRALEAEQEQIDLVMDAVSDRLDALDDEAYQEWMAAAILRMLTSSDERIVIASKDRERFSDAWRQSVEAQVHERGMDFPLQIEWSDEVEGAGFILRHAGYDVDMTFSEILRVLRTDRRADVARILSGD